MAGLRGVGSEGAGNMSAALLPSPSTSLPSPLPWGPPMPAVPGVAGVPGVEYEGRSRMMRTKSKGSSHWDAPVCQGHSMQTIKNNALRVTPAASSAEDSVKNRLGPCRCSGTVYNHGATGEREVDRRTLVLV